MNTRWGELPLLSSLSDEDLSRLLRERLAEAERSPDDRHLLGAIDVLRAEIAARGGDPLADHS